MIRKQSFVTEQRGDDHLHGDRVAMRVYSRGCIVL